MGNCIEKLSVQLPAVITVLPEINKPRIPSLKQVLGASKKPTQELKVADLGLSEDDLKPRNSVKALKGFVMNRKNEIYKEGSAEEKVNALVASLTKEGLL